MLAEQTDRAVRVLARILADGRISARTLATEMGISDCQLGALRWERQRFPAELAPALYEALAPIDAALALWAYTEIVGLRLMGHEARPLPPGLDRDAPAIDALQTAEALGQVQGGIARAGSEVDYQEAAAMLPATRLAHRELDQLEGKLERIAAATPQLRIAGSEP